METIKNVTYSEVCVCIEDDNGFYSVEMSDK